MDERRPLLSNEAPELQPSNDRDEEQNGNGHGEETPFRSMQVFALCCAAVTEPVACFCIFPFIGEMTQRTGQIPESDVGFWAGAIESLFSVVQMALMIVYGRMSDKVGRKPVLIFSLLGLSISTMLFGLSRSLAQMIVLRCLAGSFAGSSVTLRIMVSESCNKATEARAFAWFMFARNGGIFLGPTLSGLFTGVDIIRDRATPHSFPYLAATLVAGSTCLFGTFLVVMFCEETLTKSGMISTAKDPMTTRQLLQQPGVASALLIFGYTMFLALANTAVLPIFLFTSIQHGGFGLSPFLAGLAASQGTWTLACFPSLKRRLGTRRVMQYCSAGWPLLFASFALINELLRRGWLVAFWSSLAVPIVVGGGIAMSFAGAQLLVNDTCPSPHEMAHINALTQTLNSAVRAVIPAAFTSVYAAGTRHQIIDGHLCWAVLIVLALPLSVGLQCLPGIVPG